MKVRFFVLRGAEKGLAVRFSNTSAYSFGRDPEADFRLNANLDPHISRRHFIVEIGPSNVRLIDMGSRNGTYVNGRKVDRIDLNEGDEIKIGRTVLRFEVVSDSAVSSASGSWAASQSAESFA